MVAAAGIVGGVPPQLPAEEEEEAMVREEEEEDYWEFELLLPLLFPGAFPSTISSSSSLVLYSVPTARTVSSAPGRSFPSPSARTEKSPVLILAYFCYHCCSTVSSNESLCREREIKKKYREEENLSKVGGKLRYCCAGTCQ